MALGDCEWPWGVSDGLKELWVALGVTGHLGVLDGLGGHQWPRGVGQRPKGVMGGLGTLWLASGGCRWPLVVAGSFSTLSVSFQMFFSPKSVQ
jgi:hypothetical protein